MLQVPTKRSKELFGVRYWQRIRPKDLHQRLGHNALANAFLTLEHQNHLPRLGRMLEHVGEPAQDIAPAS